MKEWLDTFAEAADFGFQRALVVTENLYDVDLSPAYTVAHWCGDPLAGWDYVQAFLATATILPTAPQWPPAFVAVYENALFDWEGQQALGLGAAYAADGLGVSARSHEAWKAAVVRIQLADEGGDTREVEVHHASEKAHFKEHSRWRAQRLSTSVTSGRVLWSFRDSLFPHLIFSPEVRHDCDAFSSGDELRLFTQRLVALHDYAREWIAGPFDPSKLPGGARRDGEATLGQFPAERTRTIPGNHNRPARQKVFSWHLSGSGGTRVYFEPLESDHAICVGILSKHLRTTRFR